MYYFFIKTKFGCNSLFHGRTRTVYLYRYVCSGISTKLHYTDTGYGHDEQHHQRTSSQQFYILYNKFTTNGQKFATSQCQSPTSRHVVGGVQHVRIAGVRVVEFGTYHTYHRTYMTPIMRRLSHRWSKAAASVGFRVNTKTEIRNLPVSDISRVTVDRLNGL